MTLTGNASAATFPHASEHGERASHRLVRGGTRTYHFPRPTYLQRGEGAYVWDVDGRRLLDCCMCFGSMILGHAHPEVTRAIVEAAPQGTALGTPTPSELTLAEEIASRVPWAERIAFANSGTEATTAALRIARATTGRSKLAKCEGGYHGWNDPFLYSLRQLGGPVSGPETVPVGSGLTDATGEQVVVLPYNEPEALEVLDRHADEIAVLFVEAIQGAAGAIVPDEQWLRDLRERCRKHGIVFVCDEVITGFRVGPGGASERFGLDPDLVTYGKIAGGGLPIGVVAGKQSVMESIAPQPPTPGPLLFGTFSANALTMVAGLKQLSLLGDAEYVELSRKGETVRGGLRALLEELGITAQVTGVDSLWGLHFIDGEVRNIRATVASPEPIRLAARLAELLHAEGLLVHTPMHISFVSTAHDDEAVAEILDIHRRVLSRMVDEGEFA